jgi:flagellar biosynthesis/type III secretory pathway protein FliH
MATAPAKPAPTVVAYSFRQLETPAGGAVHNVADVLSDAWGQADKIREDARAAGEAQGRADGLAAAQVAAAPALAALAEALRGVQALQAELVEAIEGDAILLALRLSEEILAGAISVQPERLIDVTRLALRHLIDRRLVTLVVNPEDLELLSDAIVGLQSELGGIEHCNVQADRRVGRGGVIVRTEAGELDATIDAQLSRAREVVATALAGGPGDEH